MLMLSCYTEPQQRRSQWESHLGWSDLPNINESRRHSLADIPTRRGSLSDEGYGANSFSHLHARRPVLPPSGLGPNSREHGRDHGTSSVRHCTRTEHRSSRSFYPPPAHLLPCHHRAHVHCHTLLTSLYTLHAHFTRPPSPHRTMQGLPAGCITVIQLTHTTQRSKRYKITVCVPQTAARDSPYLICTRFLLCPLGQTNYLPTTYAEFVNLPSPLRRVPGSLDLQAGYARGNYSSS